MKHIEAQMDLMKAAEKKERLCLTRYNGYAIIGDAYKLYLIPETKCFLDFERLRRTTYVSEFSRETSESMLIYTATTPLTVTGKEYKQDNKTLIEFLRSDDEFIYVDKKMLKRFDLKCATFSQRIDEHRRTNGGVFVLEHRECVGYVMPCRRSKEA